MPQLNTATLAAGVAATIAVSSTPTPVRLPPGSTSFTLSGATGPVLVQANRDPDSAYARLDVGEADLTVQAASGLAYLVSAGPAKVSVTPAAAGAFATVSGSSKTRRLRHCTVRNNTMTNGASNSYTAPADNNGLVTEMRAPLARAGSGFTLIFANWHTENSSDGEGMLADANYGPVTYYCAMRKRNVAGSRRQGYDRNNPANASITLPYRTFGSMFVPFSAQPADETMIITVATALSNKRIPTGAYVRNDALITPAGGGFEGYGTVDGSTQSNIDQYVSTGGATAVPSASGCGVGPVAILTEDQADAPVIGFIGDSRNSDSFIVHPTYNSQMGSTALHKAFADAGVEARILSFCHPSDNLTGAQGWLASHGLRWEIMKAAGVKALVCAYPYNDVGSNSALGLATALAKVYAEADDNGVVVFQTTAPPAADWKLDLFATAANQNLGAGYLKIATLNDWIRLGCPMRADGVTPAMPTYANPADPTTAVVPDPLGVASARGFKLHWDQADALETSRNSGKFTSALHTAGTITSAAQTNMSDTSKSFSAAKTVTFVNATGSVNVDMPAGAVLLNGVAILTSLGATSQASGTPPVVGQIMQVKQNNATQLQTGAPGWIVPRSAYGGADVASNPPNAGDGYQFYLTMTGDGVHWFWPGVALCAKTCPVAAIAAAGKP